MLHNRFQAAVKKKRKNKQTNKQTIFWLLCSVNGENRKTSPLIYNHGQKSLDTFAFVELFSIHTYPAPLPPHKQRWTRLSRMFSEFQHWVGWGKRELQEKFERDALFNEGTRNYRKFWMLHYCPKEFCLLLSLFTGSKVFDLPYLSEISNFPGIMWIIVGT